MKVFYLSLESLNSKIEKDWYILDLQEAGIEVMYCTIGNYFNYKEYNSNKSQINISSLSQLKCLIKKESLNSKFVILFPYDGRFVFIFILLKLYKCKTYFIAWGANPNLIIKQSLFKRIILNKVNYNIISNYFYKQIIKFTHFVGLTKNFEVVLTSGNINYDIYRDNCKIVIESHLPDYDNYINAKPHENLKKYAVFLDVNLPFHLDLDFHGIKKINSKIYLNKMNIFFKKIEDELNLDVIIALHPSSSLENYKILNRKMYLDNTPGLVKGAEFVLSHHSTSISYAVLDVKPIIFIYTDEFIEMYKNNIFRQIINLSTILGSSCINIDSFLIENIDFNINTVNYDKYKFDFIISKNKLNHTAKQIFMKTVLDILR